MGALFLHLKPDEYLKKLYKTKKLVEKTSFSLQAEKAQCLLFFIFPAAAGRQILIALIARRS
ncbi:hypothetical protein P8791_20940 [Bacillus subtilis]|nr:hypothetical protein [Bacillus subtilis]MEC0323605.1 hypothetical protein [Bacillus subtilis]